MLFSEIQNALTSSNTADLLRTLEFLANSATVAGFLGLDQSIQGVMERLAKIFVKNNPPQVPTQQSLATDVDQMAMILRSISLIEERLTELEKTVYLPVIRTKAALTLNMIQNAVNTEDNINIARLAIEEARLRNGCIKKQQEQEQPQHRRFLYLASENYAGIQATLDIAIHHQFLWRKYFAGNTNQRVNRVKEIRNGDFIVLAYRLDNPTRHFRVLSTLIVNEGVNRQALVPIPNPPMPQIAPFRMVTDQTNEGQNLNQVLQANNYLIVDQRIGNQVGLPVCMYETDLQSDRARNIYNNFWRSPGPDSVYELNSVNNEIQPSPLWIQDPTFRDWMATL